MSKESLSSLPEVNICLKRITLFKKIEEDTKNCRQLAYGHKTMLGTTTYNKQQNAEKFNKTIEFWKDFKHQGPDVYKSQKMLRTFVNAQSPEDNTGDTHNILEGFYEACSIKDNTKPRLF